jgi:hypothetical protein
MIIGRDSEALRTQARTFTHISRPFLSAVKDANNLDYIAGDTINHDPRQRRQYKFASPCFPAWAASVRKVQQP